MMPRTCLTKLNTASLYSALSAAKSKAVLRGGAWNNNGQNCRSAYRNHNHAGKRNNNIGLRLALARRGMDVPLRPAPKAVVQTQRVKAGAALVVLAVYVANANALRLAVLELPC